MSYALKMLYSFKNIGRGHWIRKHIAILIHIRIIINNNNNKKKKTKQKKNKTKQNKTNNNNNIGKVTQSSETLDWYYGIMFYGIIGL